MSEIRSPNDPYHTHISMGPPKGVYFVGTNILKFWNLYMEELDKNTNKLYIAENPGNELPILVDIDLKIEAKKVNNRKEKIYTHNQIKEIIKSFQKIITEVVDFDNVKNRKDAYLCVLLEKDPYFIEKDNVKYIKSGFHLHFPKIFLKKTVHEVYIFPKVKELIKDIFSDLDIYDFLDTNVIHTHWLLYGSQKVNGSPYIATKCFLKNAVEVDLEDGLYDYKIAKYKEETEEDIDCSGNVKKMLPRILSIFLYDRYEYFYNSKISITTPLLNDFEYIKLRRNKMQYTKDSTEELMKEAETLLSIINPERFDERSIWLNIGFALWNISEGGSDGFSLWIEHSERSSKFNEAECFSIWNKMVKSNFTIGTIKYYAKLDNKEKYNEYINNKDNKLLQNAIFGCHYDVAKILFNSYENEFVCSSIQGKEWYHFDNHIWKKLDMGTTLRKRISDNNCILIKYIESYEKKLKLEIENIKTDENFDSDELKKLNKKLSLVQSLFYNTKKCPWKNHVMIESQDIFYRSDFIELMNNNPNLIAFKNGIYDFTTDIFRDGNPEDYISTNLPINYIDFKTFSCPEISQVDIFFSQIFPDIDIKNYFLREASKVFIGGNHDKVILFWTGDGNNGKTITQKLFEKMLGPLAVKFSTSLITGKKSDLGKASPELARAGGGVRWAVMDEPNASELILAGTLKALTGNDSYWARDLYEKGKGLKEITPMFKLHMICNTLPSIQDADEACWNRVRVIPFESSFKSKKEMDSISIKEQIKFKIFQIDLNMEEKLNNMTEPLAWYLLKIYQNNKIIKDNSFIPDKVNIATNKYRDSNDDLSTFEKECIIHDSSITEDLTIAVLYSYIKSWYREEFPEKQIPKKSNVKFYFDKKWRGLWKNKKCKDFDTSML